MVMKTDTESREDLYRERAEAIARHLRDFTIIELNYLTLALMKYGIAASFNQYIPEIHDEIVAPEETRESDPSLDNAFGGREPE